MDFLFDFVVGAVKFIECLVDFFNGRPVRLETASSLVEERNKCAEFSRQFYQQKDRQRGQQYSVKTDELNEKIFKILNPSGQSVQIIDLHYLYVHAAIKKLQERISLVRRKRLPHLDVIVGRGSHSKDGPKLKPAVAKFLLNGKFDFKLSASNEGCIHVEFEYPSPLERWMNLI